jgi:hypothetical protein
MEPGMHQTIIIPLKSSVETSQAKKILNHFCEKENKKCLIMMLYTYRIEVAYEEICSYIHALLILGSLNHKKIIKFHQKKIHSPETH